VRKLVGDDMIVGISTHNPKETELSRDLSVNYVGVGPVYATPTKNIPDPVLGLDTMKEMVDIAHVPAVTLGGIDFERLQLVLAKGARNFAMVRPICDSENPIFELKKILAIQKRYL